MKERVRYHTRKTWHLCCLVSLCFAMCPHRDIVEELLGPSTTGASSLKKWTLPSKKLCRHGAAVEVRKSTSSFSHRLSAGTLVQKCAVCNQWLAERARVRCGKPREKSRLQPLKIGWVVSKGYGVISACEHVAVLILLLRHGRNMFDKPLNMYTILGRLLMDFLDIDCDIKPIRNKLRSTV